MAIACSVEDRPAFGGLVDLVDGRYNGCRLDSVRGHHQGRLEPTASTARPSGPRAALEVHETLSVIRSSGTRMSTLIDGLLQLSKVTRAPLRRESFDLVPLVRDIVAALRSGEPTRRVSLVLPDALLIDGDPALVTTLLENLLGNAWKFTRDAPEARIELGTTERNGAPCCFVRDNGAGFEMSHAGRLFHPFERLHHADEFPGTGIGLATVERAVRRHGGTLFAEAAIGAGATFFFSLASSQYRG